MVSVSVRPASDGFVLANEGGCDEKAGGAAEEVSVSIGEAGPDNDSLSACLSSRRRSYPNRDPAEDVSLPGLCGDIIVSPTEKRGGGSSLDNGEMEYELGL